MIAPRAKAQLLEFVRQASTTPALHWVRTGVHALDLLMGNGIPVGRILEVYGPEAGGKSLFAWTAALGFQRQGGVVLLYDVEATAPREWMHKLGITEDLLIWRKGRQLLRGDKVLERSLDSIETITNDALDIIPRIRQFSRVPILMVIDSIAATSSESEWEQRDGLWISTSKGYLANRARALSLMLPRLVPCLASHQATLIAVNQLRERPGVLYGKRVDTPGGRALKFYSTIRIELSRKGRVEKEGQVLGVDCQARIEKTKLTPPFRSVLLRLWWDRGFDPWRGLPELLVERGLFKPGRGAGSWIWQGKAIRLRHMPELVRKHPELIASWL